MLARQALYSLSYLPASAVVLFKFDYLYKDSVSKQSDSILSHCSLSLWLWNIIEFVRILEPPPCSCMEGALQRGKGTYLIETFLVCHFQYFLKVS